MARRTYVAQLRLFNDSIAGRMGDEQCERARTSVHETGHVFGLWFVEEAAEFIDVTIVPDGDSAGATTSEGRDFCSRKQMFANIMLKMAGKIAEEIVFGNFADGCRSDLEEARGFAMQLSQTRSGVQQILADAEEEMRSLMETESKKQLLKKAILLYLTL
uniref:Peptidase M41 domain-containing protein n=1 Tax=Globodera rostochiensis TaxID=31243 RepID=A0A914GPW3_GLORO